MSTDKLLEKAMGFKIAFRHTGDENTASMINDLIQEVVQWRELALLNADELTRKDSECWDLKNQASILYSSLDFESEHDLESDYRETIADVRASQYPV